MLITLLVALQISGVTAVIASPVVPPSPTAPADFLAFLDTVDAAQKKLQNGDASDYKDLWLHSDYVTITGGFGGTIEKGWPAVSRRLDWAASQFSQGENTIERITAQTRGDLGYVVQTEHIQFVVPGQTAKSTRMYRVTMIFEHTAAGWRMIHRHADGQVTKQPARE